MARRKPEPDPEIVATPESVTTESTSEPPEGPVKPKATRRKKTETAVEAASIAADAAVEAKPKRSRKKVIDEPVATESTEEKPKRTRRKKAEPEAKATVVDEPTTEDAVSEKPRRARRKKLDAPAEAVALPPEPHPDEALDATLAEEITAPVAEDASELENYDDEEGRFVPIWRPRQKRGPSPASVADTLVEHDDDDPLAVLAPKDSESERTAPRRRRRKRDRGREEKPDPEGQESRSGRRREEKPAESKPEPVVVHEPEPVRPTPSRPNIPIPAGAPQVVMSEGRPVLVKDKRVYPPLWLFGSAPDERRMETVLEEIRMAADSGVHVHALLVDLEVDREAVDDAAQFAAYLLKKAVDVDPEAQVVFRVVFVAPRGWEKRYSKARFFWLDNTQAEPSICDDDYWSVARECLEGLVRRLRLLSLRDHIMGVHLDRGEWFYPENNGYDVSAAAKEKFREWARTRYNNDVVSLRAAWFDGQVDFKSIGIPSFERERRNERFIRMDRRERKWVDYHWFLSDATVFRIGELAYAVKSASEGHFLCGVSYGYSFEWSHPYSGHLSLGKLLRTPEIDFIAGPPSYKNRTPGESAPFPGPIDSFALNGKLYISEEDFKTSIGNLQEPDEFNPVIKTPQALESVHWRGLGAALAHASGVCWMDLWGNGWLRTNSIWERAKKAQDMLLRRTQIASPPPDVAVFIDERSLAYLADAAGFNLLVRNVRESVLRAGLSAGFYLLSDLAHREVFPESKLYIFLNAWDMRPEYRSAIKSRLQRDDKVLFWLYCGGMFESGRDSLERVREITGIALRPQPFNSRSTTTVLSRKHPLAESLQERPQEEGRNLEPSYFAIPEDAHVLGEYTQTGLPSFVVREFPEPEDPSLAWKSVFLGEPPVTAGLIRALAQMAGAHVWSYSDDVVHARPPFVTLHATSTGPRALTLPDKWVAYDLVNGVWLNEDARHVKFNAVHGTTYGFLVGLREEIEAILAMDPQSLSEIEVLPEREINTISPDDLNFDVPVIKLGDWMEGDISDEGVDDIFFWPKIEDLENGGDASPAEPVATEKSTGRRRRRRKQKTNVGSPGDSPFADIDDQSLNVMFRKRE